MFDLYLPLAAQLAEVKRDYGAGCVQPEQTHGHTLPENYPHPNPTPPPPDPPRPTAINVAIE